MLSLPFGALFIFAVLATTTGGFDFGILLNQHSAILVIGGTLGVLALASPIPSLRGLFRSLWLLAHPIPNPRWVERDLLTVGEKRTATTASRHALLTYAQALWEQGLDQATAAKLLRQRFEQMNRELELAVSTLRNLSKYPPALGMMGTVLGLLGLFANLTPATRDKIGPNLAVAMTATFYGLLLANAILMPLAEL